MRPSPTRRPLAALACAAAALLAGLAGAAPAVAAERTGRYLVLFERGAEPPAASAAIARAGARRAGPGAPGLDIRTVRGPAAAIRALRRDPRVAQVVPEYRREFRRDPNDPGWRMAEPSPGAPAGTPLQWALRRSGFPAAWDVTTGGGALLGIIDSGIDGGHPELGGKIDSATALGTSSSPRTDENGHGTHVSGLGCAATDNGAGLAGAGFDCRVAMIKAPQLRDEDIVRGIQIAVERGAEAINMSFGGGPSSAGIDRAINEAVSRGVVLVAAAANRPVEDQGSPASQLQPGNAPDIDAGRGLVVTAVDFQDRPAGTGRGRQISLAAYGFFGGDGPPGVVSTYPGNSTPREGLLEGPCNCRTSVQGDDRYAYLQGTSMSAPLVTAAAALVGDLNPDLTAPEKLRIIKSTARRAGGWSPELGWGILDAGAAVDSARRADRTAPRTVVRGRKHSRVNSRGFIRVRLRGYDPEGHPGLIPSEIDFIDVYARRHGTGRDYDRVRRVRGEGIAHIRIGHPGDVYRFYTRAVDRQGNREGLPERAGLVTRALPPRR